MESTSRLSSEYIAVEFNGETKKLLNTLENVEPSYPGSDYIPVEARYLTSGELGANESKTYTIKLWMDESVTVEDDAMNKNFISKIVVTAKQSHKELLVDYVMNDNETEEFTHEATSQTPALTDYRYTGANPNNYVCFGSEESVCPEDNLYRIIGVIPTQSEIGGEYESRVKLIKANYYLEQESGLLKPQEQYEILGGQGYQWNSSKNNNWEESTLNTEVLNKVYWNSLEEYQNYIALSVWYLGAPQNTKHKEYSPEQYYERERSATQGSSKGAITYANNIGLMYPSDYAFSIGKKYQNDITYNHYIEYGTEAWITLPGAQWTISPEELLDNKDVWRITKNGIIDFSSTFATGWLWSIRPTFYLKSNVQYKSGKGTKENPLRIGINE